jgi:hypothetical protein
MRSTLRNPTWMLAALLVAELASSAPSDGQEPSPTGTQEVDAAFRQLDPETRSIVEAYLRTDCELDEVGLALDRLVAVAERATPYLQAVVRQGPPAPVRTELERGLEASWAARQRFLETPEARELGEESFQMMQAISRDDYSRVERQSLDAKYRERAALALRKIEGDGGDSPPAAP